MTHAPPVVSFFPNTLLMTEQIMIANVITNVIRNAGAT